MKHFFGLLLLWIVILAVFTFLFAAFFFDPQYIYRAVLPTAFVFAAITYGFETQTQKIKTLEQRVAEMETKLSGGQDSGRMDA